MKTYAYYERSASVYQQAGATVPYYNFCRIRKSLSVTLAMKRYQSHLERSRTDCEIKPLDYN